MSLLELTLVLLRSREESVCESTGLGSKSPCKHNFPLWGISAHVDIISLHRAILVIHTGWDAPLGARSPYGQAPSSGLTKQDDRTYAEQKGTNLSCHEIFPSTPSIYLSIQVLNLWCHWFTSTYSSIFIPHHIPFSIIPPATLATNTSLVYNLGPSEICPHTLSIIKWLSSYIPFRVWEGDGGWFPVTKKPAIKLASKPRLVKHRQHRKEDNGGVLIPEPL